MTGKPEACQIANQFLEEYQWGCYRFRAEFRTQRQIAQFLAPPPDASAKKKAHADWLTRNLLDLVSEVLFLENKESESDAFHPGKSSCQ